MRLRAARLLHMAVMCSCLLPQLIPAAQMIEGVALPGVPAGFTRDNHGWCAGKFAQNDELLAGLAKLGLKSSISGTAILDAARGLEDSSAQDFSARQRATALLSQLDKLAQKGAQLRWGLSEKFSPCPSVHKPGPGLLG